MAALTVDFRKHSGPTPADDMAAQIITDCGNFTLDFKQHGFCASSLFLQTLGSWFPNEMQNWLSSEKRTLDHWATVQFFFSLAQVRRFWWCFCFRSGLVALFLKISERGDSWCTDSSFSSLLVKLSQVFESVFSTCCCFWLIIQIMYSPANRVFSFSKCSGGGSILIMCTQCTPFNTFYMQCILGVIIIIWLKKMTIIKLFYFLSPNVLLLCFLKKVLSHEMFSFSSEIMCCVSGYQMKA